MAEVKSTVLRDSSTSCMFNFWVYLAGLEGAAELQPTLTHTELGYTTRLDRLDGSVVGEGEWSQDPWVHACMGLVSGGVF